MVKVMLVSNTDRNQTKRRKLFVGNFNRNHQQWKLTSVNKRYKVDKNLLVNHVCNRLSSLLNCDMSSIVIESENLAIYFRKNIENISKEKKDEPSCDEVKQNKAKIKKNKNKITTLTSHVCEMLKVDYIEEDIFIQSIGRGNESKSMNSLLKKIREYLKTKQNLVPKRRMSAFQIFSSENQLKIRSQCINNGTEVPNFSDINRETVSVWKSMSVEDRNGYDIKKNEDEVRYQNELKSYCKRYPRESLNYM